MFDSLFTTKPVDIGGGIVAHVLQEPTMAVLRAIERAGDASEQSRLSIAVLSVSLVVDHWTGDGAPGVDEWPSLSMPGAVDKRREVLDMLPQAAFERLALAANDSYKVTAEDEGNSDAP